MSNSTNIILTTERLQIRPYTLEDAPFVLELLNTPQWIANIGDRGIKILADAEKYIEEKYFPMYEEYDYGGYVTEKIGTNEIVGTSGIFRRPDLEHPDIGFALLPKYIGQGYAFEAAYAVKEYATNTLKLEPLYGITLPTNSRSIRLLEKLGFRSIDRIRLDGDKEELLLFSTEY